MVDNEIRLRTELEGCDRMIVERYKALGNKAATISPGDLPQDLRSRRTDGGVRALRSSLRNETKSSRIFRNNVGRRRGN